MEFTEYLRKELLAALRARRADIFIMVGEETHVKFDEIIVYHGIRGKKPAFELKYKGKAVLQQGDPSWSDEYTAITGVQGTHPIDITI